MTEHNDSIQRQFGNVARNYSTSAVHRRGADLDTMLASASLKGWERVLDAGCGAGHAAIAFATRAAEVIAYDLTPQMLEQVDLLAQERGLTNIRTKQGSVAQLPFTPGSFDYVISRYSAHHWADPEAALGEFRRVLKSGGRLILSDIVSFADYTRDTFLQSIELLRDPSHVRDHRIGEWEAMLRGAGFQPEVLLQFDVTLDFATWIARMQTPPHNVTAIKALLATAPGAVREALQIPADWQERETFQLILPGAVLRGH